jgi:hypothetical protein
LITPFVEFIDHFAPEMNLLMFNIDEDICSVTGCKRRSRAERSAGGAA